MQELPPGFRVVGAPQSQGDPVIAPPDPYKQRADDRAQEDQEFQREKLAMDRERLDFDREDAARKANKPTELDVKAEGTRKRAETIRAAMREVAGLYESDIKGQPVDRLFGMTEYVDSFPKNDRFRAAGNAILPLIRPLVAQTAREGDSDKEMQVFMSYVPSNDDADITIEQKMKMLDALVSGMAEGKPPSETEASFGLSGSVTYEGPNPKAQISTPDDIAAIMAKYGAQ